jgi:hypothetical protein
MYPKFHHKNNQLVITLNLKKKIKKSTRLLSQDKKYENKKIYISMYFFYFENTEAHYNITIYLFYIFIFVSSIKYIFYLTFVSLFYTV